MPPPRPAGRRDAQEALREHAVYLVLREVRMQAEAAGLRDGRRVSSRKDGGIPGVSEARRVQRWIRDKMPD